MKRIVILASGNGSNAQALVDAVSQGCIRARIAGVVTNNPGAGVINRARAASIPVVVLEKSCDEERGHYDLRLSTAVKALGADLVVLAGWMRLLTMSFLGTIGAPVVNLHPALPGEFPGTRAIERAYDERGSGRTSSGVMVHLVPDEGVDDGPVLATCEVPLYPGDSLEEFERRVHEAEHALLVEAVSDLISHSFISHTGESRC